MDQIPETLLDYLVMNACRRVVECQVAAGTDFSKITRDLVASALYDNVIDNTSVGDDDTEDDIRLAIGELVTLALPDENDDGTYQRRTLREYLGNVWMTTRGGRGGVKDLWRSYYGLDCEPPPEFKALVE